MAAQLSYIMVYHIIHGHAPRLTRLAWFVVTLPLGIFLARRASLTHPPNTGLFTHRVQLHQPAGLNSITLWVMWGTTELAM